MQAHFGTASLRPEWPAAVVCIGTFDGVHLGHRAVIATAVELAVASDLPAVLVTFDRHPAATLAPERCPESIGSLAANLREFDRIGVAVCIVLPFDRALSETSATDFLERILKRQLKAASVVVGHDFALGHDREGTPEWLAERIPTEVLPPFKVDGDRVSSSAIRASVAEGRLEDAARWLGCAFEVEGVVVAGQKLGRTIGFPTINLARSGNQVTPADGIYAGRCMIGKKTYAAAISVGVRPAVGAGPRTMEAFLLDYHGQD